MTIAVTGSTGFVGRHVVAELDRRGLGATLSRRAGGRAEWALGSHEIVSFDLASPPDRPYDAMGRPDVLLHLAWAGLPHYQSSHHIEHELATQFGFLKAMVDGGLRNLLVTGTCLEYGMQSGALHEEMEAIPVTAYGMAKNALRVQLQALQQVTPFNLTWARLFYLYGSGQAPTSLYAQLSSAAQRGDRTFDMSGGKQVRDYLPVAAASRHLVSLGLERQPIGVVNVCSGIPVTVGAMVERWISDHRWSIELNRGRYPYPDYEPMEFWGDRRKMDECLRIEADA